MSEGLNRVMLIGNLGADPELRYTQGGQAILKLRLATTERYKDKAGERQERTEWHSVILWGNRAEALSKILEKGRTIYVEGRLQTSSWDKDGVKHYKTEVNATEILLLGGGRGEQRAPSSNKHTERSAPRGEAARNDGPEDSPDGADFGDDSIPFAVPYSTDV
jgi:single stranded DNA-binding protein